MDTIKIYDATEENQGYLNSCLVQFNNSKVPFTQKPLTAYINKCIEEKIFSSIETLY